MPHPDALIWDERYLYDQEHYLRREPYGLVKDFASRLPAGGLALEVACGPAPAGVFLSGKGLRVIALDISLAGLRLAQARARRVGNSLSLAVMDMQDAWLPAAKFDLILNFYYLARPMLSKYRQAVKPGGWLFFETYLQDPDRRHNPAHTLESGELPAAFKDWEILLQTETWRKRASGQQPARRIAQLVARKPLDLERRNDEISNT